MWEFVPTGIEGLDKILMGGIPHPSTVLIEGPIGSGKSVLGMQLIYTGITKQNRPGMILALDKFPKMLFKDAENFSWNFKDLEKENKFQFISAFPDDLIQPFSHTVCRAEELIDNSIAKINAQILLIDSFSHLWRISNNIDELKQICEKIIAFLKAKNLTSFIIISRDEYPVQGTFFEEYFADVIIKLHNYPSKDSLSGENIRSIEIAKSRGQNCISGKHRIKLSKNGISIFPHSFIELNETRDWEISKTKIPTGLPELDKLLDGGLLEGSTTLITGIPGSGKTTFCVQLVKNFLDTNKKSLIASFDPGKKIESDLTFLGINIEKAQQSNSLHIIKQNPINLNLDEFIYELEKIIKEQKPQLVIIDSLTDFESSIENTIKLRNYLHLIIHLFEKNNVIGLLTCETRFNEPIRSLSDIDHSYLVDGVIHLSLSEEDKKLSHEISVLKMRGVSCNAERRKCIIDNNELKIYI